METIIGFLQTLGPVIVEGLGRRRMIKRTRTFAELITSRQGIELAFLLSRRLDSPRILRTVALSARRTAHVVAIDGPAALDDELRGWLAEAYDSSPT